MRRTSIILMSLLCQIGYTRIRVMPNYQYEPLPDPASIRLLEIHPGNGPVISCSLQVMSLRDEPLYDALSYAWGGPRPASEHARHLESLPTG